MAKLGGGADCGYRRKMAGSFLGLDLSERRFGQWIVVFVGLGFLALIAAGAGAAWMMSLNLERTAWVTHTYEVERRLSLFQIEAERLESARRGYMINQDPSFAGVYADASAAIPDELEQLKALTTDNPRQQTRIALLGTQAAQLEAMLSASMAAANDGQTVKALQDFTTDGSVALTRRIRATIADMLAEENGLLTSRVADEQQAVRDFFIILALSTIILLVVATGSILVILRYTRELARSAESLRGLNDNLEQAVDARTQDLQRANDEIQRFAYIVSHDLRAPLVNVLGFTAELDAAAKPIGALIDRAETEAPQIVTDEVRDAVRQDVPEAIGFIRSSTQKMDRLINAILKLSREGRRTITPEPLDMDNLVQGIADSLRHRVSEIGARIIIAKPLPPVTTDSVAIEQILSNLVENAVKYLKPDQPGQIRISGHPELGRVIFEVADNGRGIDPKDHERIFDLFRRSGFQDQPGEGIGLAHVRTLAYRLGGVVSCDSTLGEGAVFRLSLPLVYSGEAFK